jgi:hypothetical protein
MPREGFEPTIPAFEKPKTLHALDCAATVTGSVGIAPLFLTSALDRGDDDLHGTEFFLRS